MPRFFSRRLGVGAFSFSVAGVFPRAIASAFFFITLIASIAAANDWEIRRDEQRRSYDSLLDNVPLLPQTQARQLMRLRVEEKMLTLRTPLFSTEGDGYARVKLRESAFALVRVLGGADSTDGENVSPLNFQFTLNDYSQPRQITTYSVSSEQTYLTISKSVQLPDGYGNVQLIERVGPVGNGRTGSVELVVSRSGDDGQSPVNLSVEAANFYDLVRANHGAVEAYLRPLLRELGQEEALAPDPLVAWQVFASRWEPEAGAAREVGELLPKLDADDFRERENASSALEKLGRAGAAVMVRLDRKTLSAEQNARVDRAMCAYAQLPPKEAERMTRDLHFLLDCLYCDEIVIRRAACERLNGLLRRTLEIDVTADDETRCDAILHTRQRLLESAVVSIAE